MTKNTRFRMFSVSSPSMGSARLASGLRFLPILWMAGILVAYVIMHTTLRDMVVRLVGSQSAGSFLLFNNLTLPQALTSFSGLFLILASFFAAWISADRFPGEYFERPLIFGLCAFTFIVFPSAALGEIAELAGAAFLRPPGGPFLAAIPALILIFFGLSQGWRPCQPKIFFERPSALVLFIGGLAGITLASAVAIALMHPATSGDALSYHAPLALYFWQDGNLGSFLERTKALWAFAHPGMAELWFGLLWTIAGESLANFGQLPFTLLGILAIYAFSLRLGLGRGAASLASLSFPLIPIVIMQSVMQPNDVAGAALFMVAIALASAPVTSWKISRLGLLGVCLGLIATTKLVLLPYVFAIGLFLAVAIFWHAHRQRSWRTTACICILAMLFLITVSPWWVRNIIRYQNPVFPSAIPLIGRGVVLQNMGTIDNAFVPSKLAWPLYPLIAPHDDRSGFGALFLVAAIPGSIIALRRARRQPLFLLFFSTAIMLPAWWLITLHEPRFFLGPVSLSCAFIPWTLAAVPSQKRRLVSILLAGTALFSTLVTFDQGLLTFARQPNQRAAFYDRVWGVDAYVTALPESEPILLNNGFAPTIQEYTAFYPLLGESQSRLVVPVDWEVPINILETMMRRTGVRYVYVSASPENRGRVQKIYGSPTFELVHQSAIVVGEKSGARRVLYRLATPDEEDEATWRYLFRLR